MKGLTTVGPFAVTTTGLLGASRVDGELTPRAFPSWLTIPSYQDLGTGRRWHFFFAWFFVINGFVYLLHGLISRHFKRDLLPTRANLRQAIWRMRSPIMPACAFAKGEKARRYNALQKLSYVGVAFLVLPLMVLTGLTMSPGFNAIFPWLLDLFGGRQSARTIHFIAATLIVPSLWFMLSWCWSRAYGTICVR